MTGYHGVLVLDDPHLSAAGLDLAWAEEWLAGLSESEADMLKALLDDVQFRRDGSLGLVADWIEDHGGDPAWAPHVNHVPW